MTTFDTGGQSVWNVIDRRRQGSSGTSFFLNFHPAYHDHQIDDEMGEYYKREIVLALRRRFCDLLREVFATDPPSLSFLERELEVSLTGQPQHGHNNGEIYLWLKGLALRDKFILKILTKLKDSIEKNPIVIKCGRKGDKVEFYGWGFRYI